MKKGVFSAESNTQFKSSYYEGESIEEKVDRLMTEQQPIEADPNAAKIYTKRSDGVLPQYNIRTDKWEIAQSTMDEANRVKIAKSEALTEQLEGEDETAKESSEQNTETN